MYHQQHQFSRNIAAAAWHNTPVGRFLCSAAVGSRGNIEKEDKNITARTSDGRQSNLRRSTRLGGNQSDYSIRTPSKKDPHLLFKHDNLRMLENTFNGGNIRNDHITRNSTNTTQRPPRSFTKYKSNYISENAENREIYKRIIKCKTIDVTVKVAHEHLDNNLSPRTTAAVWKHISSLLLSSNPQMIDGQLKRKIEEILSHTSSQISVHNPSVLASTSHALASIVKTALSSTQKHSNKDNANQLFDDLFANVEIWDKIQQRYLRIQDSFGARQVATLAWSLATVMGAITTRDRGNYSSFDVSPFFRAAHRAFQSRKDEFTSKHISNLAWSCMTCKHSMPELFNDLADEFISRRRRLDDEDVDDDEESLDAVTLCQLAHSFANAKHHDVRFFEAIAREALPILPDFKGRHLANLIHPFAYAKIVPKFGSVHALFDEVANVTILQVKSLSPQNMANIVWAYATTEQAHQELFNAIAQEATPRLQEFSPKQLANLTRAFSKYPPKSSIAEIIFDRIATEVVDRGLGPGPESFTPQGLTMMAHSFATVGHTSDEEFWNAVEESAIKRIDEFGCLECVQMAWAFATIERSSDELFRYLERIAISNISTFNSQGLSNLSWAFSVLGYDSLPLFQAIAERSIKKMNEFKPKEKAMLVLSFSRIGHHFPLVFDKVASLSISELESFGSLDLLNMVVSYVKADASKRNKLLMKSIAEEIVRRPSSFPPKMLVGVAWSYASEDFRFPQLFKFISNVCVGHCDSFDSQEIASLAWSFVSVAYCDRLLLKSLAETSDSRWHEFGAQPLANMAWAYATAEEDRPSLFEGIANSAIAIKGDFTSQGISNLLWALSTADYTNQLVFNSLATPASLLLNESSHHSLANIAWAYSVANVEDSSLFNEQFVNICVEKEHEFSYKGLRQLHQWNLWRKELGSDIYLPCDLGKRCYNEFIEQTLISSDLQKDVVSVLDLMGFYPDEEVQTKCGYILDATFMFDGKVIGLEVDGPTHFVGRKMKGNAILKARQVARIDLIPILSVPYWEWIDLHTLEDKKSYLLSKIDQIE